MTDITIIDDLFKVFVEKGSTKIPIIGELTIGLEENETFNISLSLPTYIANRALWAAVGTNTQGAQVGFNGTYVQRIPMRPSTLPAEDMEIFKVALTSPRSYDMTFKAPTTCVTVHNDAIFYNVYATDRVSREQRLVRLAVRFGEKRRLISLRHVTDNLPGATPTHAPMTSTHTTPPVYTGGFITPHTAFLSFVTPPAIVYTRPSAPEVDCAICLAPLGEQRTTTVCYHTFCTTCITQWASTSESQTCPTCRSPLPPLPPHPVVDRRFFGFQY